MHRSAMGVLKVAAICCLAGTWNACEEQTAEPTLVTGINEPRIEQTDFPTFRTGDHVAGMLRLTIPPGMVDFEVERVRYYLDSTQIAFTWQAPHEYSIDTRMYPQGPHSVSLAVYEKSPSIGMYGLLGMPRVFCGTDVVFDQTPPAAVESLTISWDGTALIRWARSTSPSFRYYRVGVSFTSTYMPDTYTFWDTVRVRDSLQWRLSTSGYRPGTSILASVTVSNGVDFSPTVNAHGVVGMPMPVQQAVRAFFRHPVSGETYAWAADNRVYVLTADGGVIVRTSPSLMDGTGLFSQDGTRFYSFNRASRTLVGYSTGTFQQVVSLAFPDSVGDYTTCVVSPNGRIYLGSHEGKVWVFSESTGAFVAYGRFLDYLPWYPILAPSIDGRYLCMSDYAGNMWRINTEADTMVVEQQIVSSASYSPSIFQALDDGQHLLVGSGTTILLYRISDMSLASSFMILDPGCAVGDPTYSPYPTASAVEGFDLFVAMSRRYVAQYRLPGGTLMRTWCPINAPSSLGLSADGRYLYAGNMGIPFPNLFLSR